MVCAFLTREEVEKLSSRSPGCFDGAEFYGSHQMLKFGEDLLDRIEVGAVRRQEEPVSSLRADEITGLVAFVTSEIIEHYDLAFDQGKCQFLLDIEREEFAVDGTVDNPRG